MTYFWRSLILIGLSIGILAQAFAHELRPGYLALTEIRSATYEVVWKAPIRLGRPLAVSPSFSEVCTASTPDQQVTDRGVLINKFTLDCSEPLEGHRIELGGLDKTITDVLVRFQPIEGGQQALRATPDTPYVQLQPRATRWGAAQTYFGLGIEHILTGIDHLLFVLALILLITGFRRLVETITSFTIAHSLTLIATSLGWVSLPVAPVEAVIALSIIFLANELALKQSGQERFSQRQPWVVAFAFGLLHGFGFAGALSEIGLPEGEVPMALLSFNLGVEAGQLAFLAIVIALLAIISRLKLRQPIDKIASYAIGMTACFWLFQRVL